MKWCGVLVAQGAATAVIEKGEKDVGDLSFVLMTEAGPLRIDRCALTPEP